MSGKHLGLICVTLGKVLVILQGSKYVMILHITLIFISAFCSFTSGVASYINFIMVLGFRYTAPVF